MTWDSPKSIDLDQGTAERVEGIVKAILKASAFSGSSNPGGTAVFQEEVMQESRNLENLVTAAAYFGGMPRDPLEGLEQAHRIQTMLCDILEQIADSIPAAIDYGLCAQLAEQLCPVLKSVHRFEESSLFPMLGTTQAETVERLKHEHFDDECFAEELTEALSDLGQRRQPENPEALGYMLRAFFEAMRRHVAFESDHLKLLVR